MVARVDTALARGLGLEDGLAVRRVDVLDPAAAPART